MSEAFGALYIMINIIIQLGIMIYLRIVYS